MNMSKKSVQTDTYFKVYRKIFDNGIWKNPVELRLFIWLIGHAVFEKPIDYDDIIVSRGQYLRSYRKLQEDLEYLENNKIMHYPLMTIKRAADRLACKEMVTLTDTRLGTLFTIVNYDKYQPKQIKKEDYGNREEKNNDILDTGHDTSLVQTRYNINNDNNVNKYKYCQNSEEFRLSQLLLILIKQRRPRLKGPNMQKWCRHMDWLIRIDKRDPIEIERVIQWSQQNVFWQNNILSTEKLRKQYDTLAMQMDAEPKQSTINKFSSKNNQTYQSASDRIVI